MAQQCGFFNAELEGEEYDRVYNAEQFAEYFASFIGNGIFGGSMSELVVEENETPNMSVNVSTGKAWINGWWYKNDDIYNLPIDIADGVLNRIDIVVLRWGNVERDIWLQVVKGTPSLNPVAPSITRNADYYDLKLCEVSIPAGATNIKQAQISDTRPLSSVCGFVTGVVDQIDAGDLFIQFQSQFDIWLEHVREQLTEDVAGHLQNEIDYTSDALVEQAVGTFPEFAISTNSADSYYSGGRGGVRNTSEKLLIFSISHLGSDGTRVSVGYQLYAASQEALEQSSYTQYGDLAMSSYKTQSGNTVYVGTQTGRWLTEIPSTDELLKANYCTSVTIDGKTKRIQNVVDMKYRSGRNFWIGFNPMVDQIVDKVLFGEVDYPSGIYSVKSNNEIISLFENSIAPNEPATTASRAYSPGQFITNGGKLKKVTSAIPSGGAISSSNTSDTTVAEELERIISGITNWVYPVGSIYMSVNNVNPSALFGGTWVAWGSGRVPVGVNTSDTDFATVEKTGGEKSHSYTPAGSNSGGAVQSHALTLNEMPAHNHGANVNSLVGNIYFRNYGSDEDTNGDIALAGDGIASSVQAVWSGKHAVINKSTYSADSPMRKKVTIDAKHTHTAQGAGAGHTHTLTQPTFKGTASTQSHLQPYITCYMWKRTA